MIFGSENFVEILLKAENHSVLEMGCWNHILFLGGTDLSVEVESCSIFMRIIRKRGENQAFSKPVISLPFLRGKDIFLSSTFQNTPQLCCGDEPSHYE